jgi:hypothetical protein
MPEHYKKGAPSGSRREISRGRVPPSFVSCAASPLFYGRTTPVGPRL